MILTASEILKRLGKDIFIEPFDEKYLNPNSYNLALGPVVELFERNQILDMKKENKGMRFELREKGFLLQPGELLLASTAEYTQTYNLVPKIDGRSSIGRLDLVIHQTAGYGDIGFNGCWTLEISCVCPVVIYPHIRLCQISYHTICGEVDRVYHGKYQHATEVEGSKLHEELVNGGIT